MVHGTRICARIQARAKGHYVRNRPHYHLFLFLSFLALLTGVGCGDAKSPPAAADVAVDGTQDAAQDGDSLADVTAEETSVDLDTIGEIAQDVETVTPVADRPAGTRAPLTSRCDDIEPQSCFLPWPSNRLLTADSSTETGLRVDLATDVLPADEELDALQGADGFSRVTPIVVPAPSDADSGQAQGAMRLFVAEPGAAFGDEVLLRNVWYGPRRDSTTGALVGYVRRPMAPNTEHLVVVSEIDSPTSALKANRLTRVIVGIEDPETQAEMELYAYHAPARAILAVQEIDLEKIARVWDFTTRSKEDPLQPLRDLADAARHAVTSGTASISITTFETRDAGPVAAIARGIIAGLPGPDGSFDAPFRIALPRGEGSYRVVLYGHGAGGNVTDASFDELITRAGIAKAGVEVEGWTDTTIGSSVAELVRPVPGSAVVVQGMMRAQARIAAIHRALEEDLGVMLAAVEIDGKPNPAAGRIPDMSLPIWAGGSLGGVTGMVYAFVDPRVAGGILNVPGAAFTHWLGGSALYEILALILEDRYAEVADIQLVSAMAQGVWDVVDGAVWADTRETPPIFAVQISIDDPVMPNVGSEMVATSLNAVHLGGHIVEIPGLDHADIEVKGRSAVTQFIAPGQGANEIHGFTARNTDAARAAQQQFIEFIVSLWDGDPTIRLPDACLALAPPGRCDFSDSAP